MIKMMVFDHVDDPLLTLVAEMVGKGLIPWLLLSNLSSFEGRRFTR